MKKILFLLFITFFSATMFSQTIVSTEPANRNAILEEYTGKTCVNCPEGHKTAHELMNANPGRFYSISVHQGYYAEETPPYYTTPYGNALASQAGMGQTGTGYPAGTVNRQAYSGMALMGASNYLYTRLQWEVAADKTFVEPSCLNIAAEGIIDVNTRKLTLLVEVYYTGNAVQPTNKLTVAMLQNNILGPQTGGITYYPEMMVGSWYKHMHMLRDFITGQWGVNITPTTTGSFWSQVFEYNIPENFNDIEVVLENLEFIVFVAENEEKIITGTKADVTLTNLPLIGARIEEIHETPVEDCSSNVSTYFQIQNLGVNTISSVEVTYSVESQSSQIFLWKSRSIPSLTSDTIMLPFIQIQTNENQTINIEVTKINNETINVAPKSLDIRKDVPQVDNKMTFILATDRYASEISFKIFNPNGTILVEDGPWEDLSSNGITIREYEIIPIMTGCHRVEVYDSYGDGINLGYGAGYFKILDKIGDEIYYNDGHFNAKATVMTTVTSVEVGIKDEKEVDISIAPNPINDRLYITGTYEELQIISISGQILYTTSNTQVIDVSNLARGVYLVKIQVNGIFKVFKIVK